MTNEYKEPEPEISDWAKFLAKLAAGRTDKQIKKAQAADRIALVKIGVGSKEGWSRLK